MYLIFICLTDGGVGVMVACPFRDGLSNIRWWLYLRSTKWVNSLTTSIMIYKRFVQFVYGQKMEDGCCCTPPQSVGLVLRCALHCCWMSHSTAELKINHFSIYCSYINLSAITNIPRCFGNVQMFNSLRPCDAYMRRWTNHHWFR